MEHEANATVANAGELTRRGALRGLSGVGLVAAAAALTPTRAGAARQDVTEADIEALADRFVGRFNAGDTDGFGDLLAADAPVHWFWPVPAAGPRHLGLVVGLLRTAVPDAAIAVDRLLVAGDWATALGTLRGTHTGAVLGVPATGRSFAIDVIVVGRVAGGKIAELWIQYDLAGLAVQLGGLADAAQALLGAAIPGAPPGATPATGRSAALDELLAVDGVVFAVAFGPDGSVLDYRSEIDIPEEEIEQAAAAGPALSTLLAVAIQRYDELSVLEWGPPAWVVYSGGERWTTALAGNVAIIAETAAVDFDALYEAAVGPR